MKNLELYKTMHKMNTSYGGGGIDCIAAISALIDFLKPKTILDYGCGKGGLVKALAEKYPNVKVYGYDPAVEKFSKMPVDKADLVVNTDVLEHIPEDELPETVARIASISQNVFFHLHHAKAASILPNGENAHCTIWSPQQYANLFSKYFSTINFLPGKNPAVNTCCVTFNLPDEIKNQWENLIRGNIRMYVNDLGNFIRLLYTYKENIIFPVNDWNNANVILDYLKYYNHIDRICCVAVEAFMNEFQELFVAERPVLPLNLLPHFRDTAVLFVTAPNQYHETIQQNLKRIGFKQIIFIEENLIKQFQNELQKFYGSGGMINWFMNHFTEKFREMEFRIAEQQEVCETNTAAFAEYKNRFRGKKVVIVGSGPSAKYYKPMPDAIHIALNFAWRREDISFDYLFTGDRNVNKNSEIKMQQGFEKIRHKIFMGKHLARNTWRLLDFGEEIYSMNNVRCYIKDNSFEKPIEQNICLHPIFSNGSIAGSALGFALFTYPKELYLVGCDTASNGYFYENSNPNHIKGNKNMATHKMKVGYARYKKFTQQYYPDTRIISVNPVGLKGLFEDIYTDDFLKK